MPKRCIMSRTVASADALSQLSRACRNTPSYSRLPSCGFCKQLDVGLGRAQQSAESRLA